MEVSRIMIHNNLLDVVVVESSESNSNESVRVTDLTNSFIDLLRKSLAATRCI